MSAQSLQLSSVMFQRVIKQVHKNITWNQGYIAISMLFLWWLYNRIHFLIIEFTENTYPPPKQKKTNKKQKQTNKNPQQKINKQTNKQNKQTNHGSWKLMT